METVVWLFVLTCLDCSNWSKKTIDNEYFNSSSYEGCISEAHKLINLKGLVGTWQIECKPYKRKIIEVPAQGN